MWFRSPHCWRAADGLTRADTPNHYARSLLREVRSREPERLLDALLVAAFIESRSHERLELAGARASARRGDAELADFYQALGIRRGAPRRDLRDPRRAAGGAPVLESRIEELAQRETEILAALPHSPRVH